MKVQTIEIDGFRTFENFSIKGLPKDTIFIIGRNGAGKSNLIASLKALQAAFAGGSGAAPEDASFLRSTPGGRIAITVQIEDLDVDGFRRYATRTRTVRQQVLDAALPILAAGLPFEISAGWQSISPGQQLQMTPTAVFLDVTAEQRGMLDKTYTEQGDREVKTLEKSVAPELATFLLKRIRFLGPSRNPSPRVNAIASEDLDYAAGNLGGTLFPFVSGQTKEYEDLVRDIQSVFGSIKRPVVIPIAGQALLDVSFQEGLSSPVRVDRASSGQVEALSILTAIVSSGKGGVVTLEEPEAHFHTAALRKLADLIIRHSKAGTQFIIVSHSTAMMNRPTLGVELPVFYFSRPDNGRTKLEIVRREEGISMIEQDLDSE